MRALDRAVAAGELVREKRGGAVGRGGTTTLYRFTKVSQRETTSESEAVSAPAEVVSRSVEPVSGRTEAVSPSDAKRTEQITKTDQGNTPTNLSQSETAWLDQVRAAFRPKLARLCLKRGVTVPTGSTSDTWTQAIPLLAATGMAEAMLHEPEQIAEQLATHLVESWEQVA